MLIPLAIVGLNLLSSCLASVNPAKPQMGWNSWNTFNANVNQSIVESSAARLVSSGLAKAGYEYVIIDEGWQAFSRDANGRQQANTTKFPSGIKSLSDSIHKLGLKTGIYSDAGIYDCGFYPGSYGYEEIDAETYASWGIDYLKYDNCGGFQSNTLSPTGEIHHNGQCAEEYRFSDSYRMSGDITSSFRIDNSGVCKTAYCLNTGYAGVSVLTMIHKMREISGFQAPGSWADMDMLEIGSRTMSEFEEQTHFSFWAALKSPLIIGADITNLPNSSLAILLNKEIIAISQDDAGVAVTYLPNISAEGSVQVWAGPLSSGSFEHVILALNYGMSATNITIPWNGIPQLQNSTGENYKVRDVWAAKDLGTIATGITLSNVNSHQTKVLIVSKA